MNISWAAAVALVAATACHPTSAAVPVPNDRAASASPTALKIISISGPRDGMEIVVRDSTHWRALWPFLADFPEAVRPVPPVDFESEVVVVLALGQRGGADAIMVDSIVRHGKITAVYYGARIQVRTCLNRGSAGMFTTPAIAFRLPRPAGPILFDRRVFEPPC